ncbi:hypothetical protein [Pseudomonas sp. CCC3.1]|uniref:hypothetical protein n=1 Tax=Pseudomonas sp. CCC3.1 TaxID=3048607 RepID=UPI002AC9C379|nr:hypothetical protein [Pseudomonas sp. CCC3.1]MEB0208015.1 hypothetical protein [Pseudomonas sp. CCC3.1]WPX37656.1 hypothetical protein RHM56_05580 [Pseudomonas sp. CCC3.1]
MAGSGIKKQGFSASNGVSGGPELFSIPEPNVSDLIQAGLPEGLILRKDLDADLVITMETWDGAPPPFDTEYFSLLWSRNEDSNEWELFEEHPWAGGPWIPLKFTIPSSFLLATENEGTFYLKYKHVNFIQEPPAYSAAVTIHIDKIPPNGVVAPEKMVFSVTAPITDATFATATELVATIPAWAGEDQADVSVYFGWYKGELPLTPDPDTLIGPLPITPGGQVHIPKADIYAAGDGLCCGGYVLVDKAGNVGCPSKYELMSVALGDLPSSLIALTVTDPTSGTDLLRSDVIDGHVIVNVPQVTNGKDTDTIVVKWKDHELTPGLPVGSNPPGGFNISVPWSVLWEQYTDAAAGPVETVVSYAVIRGVEPFDAPETTVYCNFSGAGPTNPDPDPANPNLELVRVVGESNVENVLVEEDEDEDIFAKILLVDPVVAGDSYQVVWNGTAISSPYVITTETSGADIDIQLNWDDIRLHGANSAMPVWYLLTSPTHANPQEPKARTAVDIDFLVLEYEEAVPLNLNPGGYITCSSLRFNADESSFGVEYKIPGTNLTQGDDVTVTWTAYTNFNNPQEVNGAEKTETFSSITAEQATNGIVWLVEPYDTHILPTWLATAQVGKGEVIYSITGKSGKSKPTNDRISMAHGGATCDLDQFPIP